jgi:RimJ/RimL family protein N-acetyltransferase
VRLDAGPCVIRPWRFEDKDSLVRHANNRNVSRNLRDRFPYPYTPAAANAWLQDAVPETPPTNFAIDVGGEAVGGIRITIGTDVARRSAEIGFWLGEAFWGRGIMTAAVRALTDHAFAHFDLCRVHAAVFAWNPASMRVLEKAGYVREGVLRRAVVKDGQVLDQVLYAIVRE